MNGPATISFPLGNGLFNFRVVGVAVCQDKLLVHKTSSDQFWSLPGGRVDFFEATRETLLREMMEETGLEAEVQELMWVSENFFRYNDQDYHEIGFYYKMRVLPANFHDFVSLEEDVDLHFHWHPLNELAALSIYPEFITEELIRNTSSVQHIVTGYKDLHA